MSINHLEKDTVVVVFIILGILIRYLPQIYFDCVNLRKKVILKAKTVTKARYVWFLYAIILSVFLLRFGHYQNTSSVLTIAILVFIIGITIGLIGLFTLNKNNSYSEEVLRYEGGTFVTYGIYSIARHPMRIGLFIELLGIVSLSNFFILWFPLMIVLTIQYIRTRDEELMLKEYFGTEALIYISTVPKFNFIYGLFKAIVNREHHPMRFKPKA